MNSTQDTAIAAAQAGAGGRLAILADEQTAGRGSRGRAWVAPTGNLNLSLMLRPHEQSPDPGYWAMLAGVALHSALAPYVDGLMLKWPNDVLLNGAKLGGILIDSSVLPDGQIGWVVVGIGANLAHAPVCAGRPAACIPAPAPPPDRIAAAVIEAFDRWTTADLRSAWLARAHPLGTDIDVITQHRRLRGRFAGLTPRGELLLEGHPAPIGSAEVFLNTVAIPDSAPHHRAMLSA